MSCKYSLEHKNSLAVRPEGHQVQHHIALTKGNLEAKAALEFMGLKAEIVCKKLFVSALRGEGPSRSCTRQS